MSVRWVVLSTALIHNQSFTLFGFEKENFQNIDFSSLLRKSVRGKIWEGNYRVHSVCFQPPSAASNKSKQVISRFFCGESLNNRWVLRGTRMNIIELQGQLSCNYRISYMFRIVCYFSSSCHSFIDSIASLQSVFRNLKKSFLAAS